MTNRKPYNENRVFGRQRMMKQTNPQIARSFTTQGGTFEPTFQPSIGVTDDVLLFCQTPGLRIYLPPNTDACDFNNAYFFTNIPYIVPTDSLSLTIRGIDTTSSISGLSGTISTEIGLLTNMLFFYLSSSDISGTIPTEMGYLMNMQDIQFDQNQLSGTIPTEMGLMTLLTTLYLYTNNLVGSIPTELGMVTTLSNFKLSDNMLI